MIRLLPKTITVRIVLVLLLGLTLTHVASMMIYYGDRLATRERLGGDQEAERIVTLFRLVNRLGAAERTKIVGAANEPNLKLSLSPQPLPALVREGDHAALLRDLILKYLRKLDPKSGANSNRVVVRYASDSMTKMPVGGATGRPNSLDGLASRLSGSRHGDHWVIQASIRLDDGSWLNYMTVSNTQSLSFPMRIVLSTTLMVLAVIVAGIWAARRVNAPLAAVARAAEHLGEDATLAKLQEKGPLEVQRMAEAFNQMQERIQNFVADRTRMLAAISHDLRTPITRLRLRAEFIEDKEQHDKTLADLDQMESMISSVLAFAKDEHEDLEQIDLAALMLSICADISDTGHSAEFEDTETVAFMGRPIALKRAFTNLVENAVKYGKKARVRLTVDSKHVIVRIEDAGPGISEENMEKVFEPFFRIDLARNIETGGAGLGLAFTRSIIRAHGGEIRLSNLKPIGLRVEVRLPV